MLNDVQYSKKHRPMNENECFDITIILNSNFIAMLDMFDNPKKHKIGQLFEINNHYFMSVFTKIVTNFNIIFQ